MVDIDNKKPNSLDDHVMNSTSSIEEINNYIEIMLRYGSDIDANIKKKTRLSFFKKVIKKCIGWYIDPKTNYQEKYNAAVTPAFGKTRELLNIHANKLSELERRVINSLEQKAMMEKCYIEKFDLVEQKQQELELKLLQMQDENKIHSDFINAANDKLAELEKTGIFSRQENFFIKSTYSQSGEDSILAYILKMVGIPLEKVDYIDLGANHAKEMSNTFFFYNNGAKGILVEANPKLIPELTFYRHRDLILNFCVDVVSGREVNFYILSGDGLSTPNYDEALLVCEKNPSLEIVDQKRVKTISYNDIVEKYLGKAPVLLSIDIEGNDEAILRSIDLDNYRPVVIVIEMIDYNVNLAYKTKKQAIKQYMETQNYDEYAFTGINSIFIDRRYLDSQQEKNI